MKKIITFVTSLLTCIPSIFANQCPSMQKPCVCSSTKHEPISITCDKAASIDVVIRALPKSLLYIDSLTISNTPVAELPPYIFKDFIIKRLKLRNNGMLDIHPEAFDGNLDSLEELELRANRFGTIPQAGVSNLHSLNTLIISEDNIPNIPDYAFNTWHSKKVLRKLELNANNLSTVSKHGFTGLKALKQLSLDKNMFERIPTEALRSLSQLEDLSMSINYISLIPVGSLPLPNLKSLSFEVNQISSVTGEAFQEIPQLLYLYLSGNLFNAVEPNMFYYINQLKVLAMGNNPNIKALSANTFQYVPSLIRLELADCSISYIESGTLQKAPKLQVIVLRNNQLTHIARTIFSALNEAVSIDLKNNKVASVDDFAFSKLLSLRHLDISDNSVGTLQRNTFYGTYYTRNPPVTRVLYLYNNPWICDQNLQWLREWLRNNGDILLTAPGQKPASCRAPAHLNGMDMRQTDPYTTTTPQALQLPTLVYIESAKKVAAAEKTSHMIENSDSNMAIPEPFTQQYHKWYTTTTVPLFALTPQVVQMTARDPGMSQAAVIGVVLGAVMGLCILSILLAVIVKSTIKWQAKKRQNEDLQEVGRSSAFSGFASKFGSGIYPRGHFQRSYHTQQQSTQYLNRPLTLVGF